MTPRPHTQRGYILFEAVVAMALLSIGVVGIQRAMQQAIVTRGQARDYTQARFLMEEVMSWVELQPRLYPGKSSGRFKEDMSRFAWEWDITKIDLPEPVIPPDVPPEQRGRFQLRARYLAKIKVTVSWTRRGREYQESLETLWSPEKLFIPEEEQPL